MHLTETIFTESGSETLDTTIVLEPGEIDPRIKRLSYSSLLTLHSCPRKYELTKLNSVAENNETLEDKVTFAFGHAVGLGVQMALEGAPIQDTLFAIAVQWKPPLYAEDTKQNKSLWHAIYAIQKFYAMREAGYLHEYDLVYHEGRPAVELSFLIELPNGFKYRGFVDAVLRHTLTGEVLVLEQKTTARVATNPAVYKNSAQAIGYSIVLDDLFPDLSSYRVLYQEYGSKTLEYVQMWFEKSYIQRARWIRELMMEVDLIAMYSEQGMYPMHGESCYMYFRECKYLGLCTMSNDRLVVPLTQKILDNLEVEDAKYEIVIGIQDLIETQLRKVGEL